MDLIQSLLRRFIFISDTSSREQIDLRLALKSMPNKINEDNVYRMEMIDFTII